MPKKLLTQEYLNSRLRYVHDTGDLIWLPMLGDDNRSRRFNTCYAGNVAGHGSVGVRGQRSAWYVSVDGHPYIAHRLIWTMMYGDDSSRPMIDHVNGDPWDNRRCNMRLSDNQTNQMNRSAPKTNTSGVKNVSWCSRMKKWKSGIKVNDRHIHLGYHVTRGMAAVAAAKGSLKHHGKFSPYYRVSV